MINLKISECLSSLATKGVQNSYFKLIEVCSYMEDHLSCLDRIQNYYWAGSICAIASYEKLQDGNVPRLAYYCLSVDAKTVEPENLGKRFNLRATVERLQLLMNGGMRLIQEKAWDIKTYHHPELTENQILDFAILSDVLKLQEMGFLADQQWWLNVVEDAVGARMKYPSFDDEQIIVIGSEIHSLAADMVRKYLETYYGIN